SMYDKKLSEIYMENISKQESMPEEKRDCHLLQLLKKELSDIHAKYDIPVVMQTVGFGHTPWHIKGVTKSLSNAYRRHGVSAPPR
ncbi:hypothetical protein MJM45_28440, partial [Salmonella enterica subsp. enterica serovar Kentucky]|nr:hypothetical protein [Salmonella enterica subsp. enterica serovar Kentucky]